MRPIALTIHATNTRRPAPTIAAILAIVGAAHAQPVNQPIAPPVAPAQPDTPARARIVQTDQSVTGADALARVNEFADAGNLPEALRVLQQTLENEADRLLQSPTDPDVMIPVRSVIHTMLLGRPDLLRRYRDQEQARALELINQGRLADVERSRFLTAAGFEATLRLAQLRIESAQFESARIVLAQLENHPDRTGLLAADVARLANTIATYLPRPAVRAWANRLAPVQQPATQPATDPAAPPQPPFPLVSPLAALDAFSVRTWAEPAPSPLQSVAIDDARNDEEENPRRNAQAWILPTLAAEQVLINDGVSIASFDSATLAPLWRAKASQPRAAQLERESLYFGAFGAGVGQIEDVANVAIGRGRIAVGAGGVPENAQRRGDARIIAADIDTGRVRWTANLREYDTAFENASVRGPIVISDDTVILSLRRTGASRRDTALFFIGLNLFDGRLMWSRLVGTIGTNPWGRIQGRPDGAMAYEGVVYRADEMGVIAAYEAATGRPLWVRMTGTSNAFNPSQIRMVQPAAPFEIHIPIAVDGGVLVIEPAPESARLLKLRDTDGSIIASRPLSQLNDPKYMVRVGNDLACVSTTRVAFVPLDRFNTEPARLSAQFAVVAPVGRAVASGERLLLPLEGQLATISPTEPAHDVRQTLSVSGNILPVGASLSPQNQGPTQGPNQNSNEPEGHLLVTDATAIHTYVPWPRAEAILDARIAARPEDPEPLLSLIELSQRAGQPARVVELADGVLTLLDRHADRPESAAARERLFDMLLSIMRRGRNAWTLAESAPTQPADNEAPAPRVSLEPDPIRDLAVLDAVGERLARAAEHPSQEVAHLFERAWLRDVQSRYPDAVEFYQQILMVQALADVNVEPGDTANVLPGTIRPARAEATDRLTALLRRVGAEAYRAFDAQATDELAALDDRATPDQYEALSLRFPASEAAPRALLLASSGYARATKPLDARRAAGRGLAAAELASSMGRPDPQAAISNLAAALLASANSPLDAEPSYRLLRRLARTYTGLTIDGTAAGSRITTDRTSPSAAADALKSTLASRPPRARLGSKALPQAQVIEGWEPMESMESTGIGRSADAVAMYSELLRRVSLWAPSLEDGQLRQIWSRPAPIKPTILRIGIDHTFVFWPSAGGGAVESIASYSGESLWRSPEFLSIFPGVAPGEPNEAISTPLDGRARSDDLLLSIEVSETAGTIALVQRTGRVAAINTNDGTVRWHASADITRVFEAASSGNSLVIAGAIRQFAPGAPGQERASATAVCYDLLSGAVRAKLDAKTLGDHPRWIRPIPGGDVLLATSEGLLRVDPQTGTIRWNRAGAPGRQSLNGWVVGDSVFILDNTVELNLWRVSLADGAADGRPVDTRAKLDLPLTATATNTSLVLASPRGIAVLDHTGKLIGSDSLDAQGTIELPAVGQDIVIAIESSRRDFIGNTPDASLARLFFLETPGGRLLNADRVRLFDAPRSLSLIDGKILVSQGQITVIIDAPHE